jgi:predicted enzyme involved in methoxymalonyl-ACP biosynthesis
MKQKENQLERNRAKMYGYPRKGRTSRSAPVGIDEYLKEIETQLERDRAKMYGYPKDGT